MIKLILFIISIFSIVCINAQTSKQTNIPKVFVYKDCIGYQIKSDKQGDWYQFFNIKSNYTTDKIIKELKSGILTLDISEFEAFYSNYTIYNPHTGKKEKHSEYNGHPKLRILVGTCDCFYTDKLELNEAEYRTDSGYSDNGGAMLYSNNITLPKNIVIIKK